jgi:hypothetical protein
MGADPGGLDLFDRVAIEGGVAVLRAIVPHALLGDAHPIVVGDRAVTAMSAIDWTRPARIPTVAAPRELPPNAGSALLNAIAVRASRAGVRALRYAGPYPTPALYRALARSFRASASEDAFCADLDRRMRELARDDLAIDFAPAPHERVHVRGDVLELRDGLERAVIAGASFERGHAVARLVAGDGATWHAEIWFGDAPYARVATIVDREITDGPHAPPALASRVIGAAFPPELRAALAELVADAVPRPIAAASRALVAARPIAWADLGTRVARRAGDGFEIHAALWERLAPLGLTRLALAIAEALCPIAIAAVVDELTAMMPR